MIKTMKTIIIACCFTVAVLIVLSIFSSNTSSSKTLKSFVTQTHHKLSQLHKLKEEFEDQPLDNELLHNLGFVDTPIIYPKHTWFNLTRLVIVSAISVSDMPLLPNLLATAETLAEDASVVIYTLDLSEADFNLVENKCNNSCIPIRFDFSVYPSHVRYLKLTAYRSIIIQEMLQRAGIVFWMEPCIRLLENASEQNDKGILNKLLNKTLTRGGDVLVWPLSEPAVHLPTSALTHPDMFPAFRTEKWKYDFQQMSEPKAIFVVNSARVHQRLMHYWAGCSLTPGCLNPIGAQDTGCNYKKKPIFRYSGCHMYDTSAFNVALGIAFGMNDKSYLDSTFLFHCVASSSEDSLTNDSPDSS